eukprot:6492685-Amphidinium_carterae.2
MAQGAVEPFTKNIQEKVQKLVKVFVDDKAQTLAAGQALLADLTKVQAGLEACGTSLTSKTAITELEKLLASRLQTEHMKAVDAACALIMTKTQPYTTQILEDFAKSLRGLPADVWLNLPKTATDELKSVLDTLGDNMCAVLTELASKSDLSIVKATLASGADANHLTKVELLSFLHCIQGACASCKDKYLS